jgi:hypothetical protein
MKNTYFQENLIAALVTVPRKSPINYRPIPFTFEAVVLASATQKP